MIRMAKLPLDGIRIIDSSYVFAGPYAAGLLADLGAEVIKIEGPKRPDIVRGSAFSGMLPDDCGGEDPWNRASAYNLLNRGKKSLVVDLKQEEGREILADLIKVSDVFIENFTPRVLRGWGLDYPNLQKIKPDLILVSNTGYGQAGPYAAYPAQATTQEATHGLAAVTGYRGGEPSKAGQSYVDFLAGWACVMSVLLGLRFRRRFGRGLWADVSMYQLGCYNLSEFVLDHITNGAENERIGNRHRQFAPQGCYRCAGDDSWCVLSVRDDEEWRALCGVIGRPELAVDKRFATEPARHANHNEIDEIISLWSAGVPKMDAMEQLQAAGVPAAAVLDGRDLHLDPHLKSRRFLEMQKFPEDRNIGARRPIIGRPWKFSRMPLHVRGPGPMFGQHNREVLQDILGYGEARCEKLESTGVLADKPQSPVSAAEMSLDERVELGRLAYWDRDYKKRLDIE
ncbi:MAG: CoA transferase [Alphaproteobacteria bacterium]|nr:CoA transferase [Alphaproteobacteria bacterium]MDP6256869.1 CoA transferase [Alphaproteobacteria bacterium]MDP7054553.1 CoA transferase [Alphaproteobacteria bacterium]MDP7227066.1 CoA transferase [Alphaproteobacteria bacterium]MDP7461767.1 CoA transferase [Alphaproteobacteria bacterium]